MYNFEGLKIRAKELQIPASTYQLLTNRKITLLVLLKQI